MDTPKMTYVYDKEEFAHFMVDFETLGLSPWNCIATSVGLVEFEPLGLGLAGNEGLHDLAGTFGARLASSEQFAAGRDSDALTVEWRKQHDMDSIEAATGWSVLTVVDALRQMDSFVREYAGGRTPIMWASNATFDITIWRTLAYTFGCDVPFGRRSIIDMYGFMWTSHVSPNDYQAMRADINEEYALGFKEHNPLYDAAMQAYVVQFINAWD